MRIPISTKLIVVTVSLLTVTAVGIGYFNSKEIEKRIFTRESENNLEKASAKAVEVENILANVMERTQILGTLMVRKGNSPESKSDLDYNFEKDQNLVAITVYKISGAQIEAMAFKAKEAFLKDSQVDTSYITRLRQQIPFPIRSVAQKNIEVRNSSLPKGPPLFTMGIPLIKDENENVTHVALADFKLGLLQKPFPDSGVQILMLSDRQGNLLAHRAEQKALARLNAATHPMIGMSLREDVPQKQREFLDPDYEKPFIGAFVKIPRFGVTVVAQTDKEIVQEPVSQLIGSVIETAGYSVSVAIFLIFLFSITLTSPIEKLAAFTEEVAKGNYEISAKKQIRTKDELGLLAKVFDDMVKGLKERAKAYAVMRQALGGSVIDTLMTMKEADMGGKRMPVTVLFSDLREFTKFSEGHTPEEVVVMLNEYFDVMVKVIEKHGGWLDKFIGDAIMAVWGVPYTGKHDAQSATQAAIDMRIALNELNNTRIKRGQHPIKIGIGLHTGDAIMGKIGATERANLTVIGDTVNQASRIEASTKAFGTDLLISHELMETITSQFQIEFAGAAEVKGKADALKLYKVRGFLDQKGQWVEVRTPYSDYEAGDADKVKIAG